MPDRVRPQSSMIVQASITGDDLITLQQYPSLYLLANIRPYIRHILEISLLPLFYPYGRYLALFYIYRLDPTLAYIPRIHSIVFAAWETHSGAVSSTGTVNIYSGNGNVG